MRKYKNLVFRLHRLKSITIELTKKAKYHGISQKLKVEYEKKSLGTFGKRSKTKTVF